MELNSNRLHKKERVFLMKKKIITLLFVLGVLFSSSAFGLNQAKAATLATDWLALSETSSSTSRIDVTGSMNVYVKNWGSKDIKYTIFKSGVSYISGVVKAGDYYRGTISLPNDEYSLRMYCGVYTRTTGCSGQSEISDN